MKLIIAEKPSLARNIVQAIGNMKKKDGYFENENYLVTWAFGHLFTLYDIEDYTNEEDKKWKMNNLPFFSFRFPDSHKIHGRYRYDSRHIFRKIKIFLFLFEIKSHLLLLLSHTAVQNAAVCPPETALRSRIIYFCADTSVPSMYRRISFPALHRAAVHTGCRTGQNTEQKQPDR